MGYNHPLRQHLQQPPGLSEIDGGAPCGAPRPGAAGQSFITPLNLRHGDIHTCRDRRHYELTPYDLA